MRHMSGFGNRTPFELKVGDVLWAPKCNEGRPIPSEDAVTAHLGFTKFLLPAALSVIQTGKVKVRFWNKSENKYQWRSLKPEWSKRSTSATSTSPGRSWAGMAITRSRISGTSGTRC